MDIDYKYIKQVLSEIKESQCPYTDSDEIYNKYLDGNAEVEKNFIFHWHLIIENNLISSNLGPIHDLKSSGLVPSPQNPMNFMSIRRQLRLTNVGIEFLSSLEEPQILNVIVDKCKNEGFPAVLEITKQLSIKLLTKKLESIDF